MSAASEHDWYDRIEGRHADEDRRSYSFWRWLPIVVGLVVFELTADPVLGVALGCVRFGEKDFATAAWLLRRDPDRARAWACAMFHMAWAFVRIGTMSLIVMILITLAVAAFGIFPVVLMVQGWGAVVTTGVSMGAFLLAAYIAIATALIGRARPWASPTSHRAREVGAWPPVPVGEVNWGENRVGSVMAFATVLTPLALTLIYALAVARAAPRGRPPDMGATTALAMLLGLMAMTWLLVKLNRRLAARHPAECWPDDTSSGAMT